MRRSTSSWVPCSTFCRLPGQMTGGGTTRPGAPIRDHFFSYSPADAISLAPDCAVQIVLAGHEELFDNRTAVIDAYDRFQGAKKRLIVIPNITHYGIYTVARPEAQKLAVEWFDQHLKP